MTRRPTKETVRAHERRPLHSLCLAGAGRAGLAAAGNARRRRRPAAGAIKIGFITKFPVDFYDTMVDAAKEWNEDHPEVERRLRPGQERHRRRGRDQRHRVDDHARASKAIAITPTSPNVQDALQKAVDAGHQGRPHRQRHPGLGRQDHRRRHRQPGRRRARRRVGSPSSCQPATAAACSQGVPGQPVARGPGDRVPGGPRRRLRGRRRRCRPTATRPRALDAAQDILTANPDVAGDLRRLRPADHRRAARRSRRRRQATVKRVVGFDAGPDEVAAIVAGDELGLGRPVPGPDGRARRDRPPSTPRTAKTCEPNIDTGTEMVTKRQRRPVRRLTGPAPEGSPRSLGAPPAHPTTHGSEAHMTRISALDVVDVRFPTSRGLRRLGRDEPRARLLGRLRRAAHRRRRTWRGTRLALHRSAAATTSHVAGGPGARAPTSSAATSTTLVADIGALARDARPATASCGGSARRRASCTWRSAPSSTPSGTCAARRAGKPLWRLLADAHPRGARRPGRLPRTCATRSPRTRRSASCAGPRAGRARAGVASCSSRGLPGLHHLPRLARLRRREAGPAVREAVADGFTHDQAEGRRRPRADDVRRLRHRPGGGRAEACRIAVDANQRWGVREAIAWMDAPARRSTRTGSRSRPRPTTCSATRAIREAVAPDPGRHRRARAQPR